ncbi:RND family efflux transporter, MFP subunit [Nitrosospira multiformis]|uniref:RND family efflux transporter, MFP subunit n=1 Tax=Nitrosospira multiformis TaxID=1231 RepID=A0A1H8H812_9PROT|nr:RND family efflux transporter, MFP subunit [Nitrosospira multiformis]
MRGVLKQLASKSMLKIIIPVLVVLAGISISWAIAVHRPSLKSELPDSGIPMVRVIEATPQAIKLNIRSQGVVVPRTEIDLVPEVAGQIVRLHPSLAAGGFFEAGEILMMIDPRDYDHAIAEAHARIAEAERLLAMEEAQAEQARQEWQVLGEGTPSPLTMREPQLAEARAKLKAAQADMVKARLQRGRCEWRSPFAGRVRNMHIGLGQYVQPGEKLARLYATDVAQIRLPLATDQFAYLDLLLDHRDNKAERGLRVALSGEFAGVTHRWEGHVIRTEGALDEETGLLHAVAEVQNPYKVKPGQPPLIPGLFVKAEIEGREQADVFVLPPGAVNASQEVLLVDAENRLHIRRVEILRREPDRILAKSGLKAGERLVISRIEVPVEGMKVSAEIVAPEPKLKKTGLEAPTQDGAL